MGAVSVLPFGRLSLKGFWITLGANLALLAVGIAADLLWLRPAGHVSFWPPQLGDARIDTVLSLIPGPATALAALAATWIKIMAVIRRLHDRGFGGLLLAWKLMLLAGLGWTAWFIEGYIPGDVGAAISAVTGVIFILLIARLLILCAVLRGQIGANRFGPDPAGG